MSGSGMMNVCPTCGNWKDATRWNASAALSSSAQAPGGDVEEIARECAHQIDEQCFPEDSTGGFLIFKAEELIAAALRSHSVDVMDEMVERSARAMQKANRPTNGMFNKDQLDAQESHTYDAYRTLARAALRAALTPRKPESSHD